MKTLFLSCVALAIGFAAFSQTCQDVSVQLKASVQTSPEAITISWLPHADATGYTIYRKLQGGTVWGQAVTTLGASAVSYTDTAVSRNTTYEYMVSKAGTFNGSGYIYTGIEMAERDNRGKLILLVDSTFIVSLAVELQRLENDLESDGWTVVRRNVARNGTPAHVKTVIAAAYALDPVNTKALFIFGHVPVPYSGNIYPDGHNNHKGAWPADVYYADIDGNWTDATVNETSSAYPRNHNIPGDGKFDQNQAPSRPELQTGRVDLYNLPAFTATEEQLLRNYLDKNHAYRKKVFSVTHRAIIDDNFGYYSGGAFSASAYRSFGPLVGSENVSQGDYLTSMETGDYLWSYGCGSGTFTSAGGVGTTVNLAASNSQGIFTMLFGSYFGDWDTGNNFLRAPLAEGKILASCWSGRPQWAMHHMALGETIGYSTAISQYTGLLYWTSYGNFAHIALMGDPTLRNDIVAPVADVIATKTGNHCQVTWTASPEAALVGYNIYRKTGSSDTYIKCNELPVSGISYTDSCLTESGVLTYMVRALKLETTPSGTYYNLSEGIMDTAYNYGLDTVVAAFSTTQNGPAVSCTNASENALSYSWDFGDGGTSSLEHPEHTYLSNGTYDVLLIAANDCSSDTMTTTVTVATIGVEEQAQWQIDVYPNPSEGKFRVSVPAQLGENVALTISDATGKIVYQSPYSGQLIDLSHCNAGMYVLHIRTETHSARRNILRE